MNIYAATETAYKNGFEAGVFKTNSALQKDIEEILSDDTEVIISEGEVFVPISTVRKLISELEVK